MQGGIYLKHVLELKICWWADAFKDSILALSVFNAPDSPFCRCATSSPGAGEVFPQRESQAVTFVAKVLGTKRKFPAVLLPLPLGEVSPQVTERAHTVSPVTKVLGITRKLPAVLLPLPLGEVAKP